MWAADTGVIERPDQLRFWGEGLLERLWILFNFIFLQRALEHDIIPKSDEVVS